MYIKKYQLKNGDIRYMFHMYTGTDKQTGKKRNTTRRGFRTKKQAVLEASKLKLAISRGEDISHKTVWFCDVYKQWLVAYKNTVRTSTYATTMNIFKNHIINQFGDKKIDTIKPSEVQKCVNSWFEIAPTNFRKWFYYTGQVFKYAIKMEYIKKNPCDMVTLPKKRDEFKEDKPNFWSKDQLSTFFKYLYNEDDLKKFTLFRVLAFSGMRRGECLALTWNDISFSDSTIDINKTLTQGIKGHQIVQPPKTRKSMRTLAMDKKTMDYLKQWQLKQHKLMLMLGYNTISGNQLVFSTRNNRHLPLSAPGKWLSNIIKEYDLYPITVHGFRHSHASALFSAGASIKEVQERLGHEDAQTTLNIYTHVTSFQNKQAVHKLENYLTF